MITSKRKIVSVSPRNLAAISDGHNVTFDASSPWNQTFEYEFDQSDGNFPTVIKALEILVKKHCGQPVGRRSAYLEHDCPDEFVQKLCECLVSLVVRSPKFRELGVTAAEHFNGPPNSGQKRLLEAMYVRNALKHFVEALGVLGKYVVMFSAKDEFIFGDGFYDNLYCRNASCPFDAKFLVPLTPRIAVLFAKPLSYRREPRVTTLEIGKGLVDVVNETVQVSSKDFLFFRSCPPELSSFFLEGRHMQYEAGDPIPYLVADIPGVR